MLALAWLIIKAIMLLIIMAFGGVLVIYGALIRFVMERPSTIARFGWLCWGMAGLGLALFIYAGSGFVQVARA